MMLDRLPHREEESCYGNWWEIDSINDYTRLECSECGKTYIIGSRYELFDIDTRKKYVKKTEKVQVERLIGYEQM